MEAVNPIIDDYNYTSFRLRELRESLRFRRGPEPGDVAPDFDLPTIHGGRFALGDHRGPGPVLLEIASITSPLAISARASLGHLYREFQGHIRFLSVYVLETLPGEEHPPLTSFAQKVQHARDWAALDAIPWTITVDALDGRTHRLYGLADNGIYLISSTRRTVFRTIWGGQEALLRERVRALVDAESTGDTELVLGQEENMLLPFFGGADAFVHAAERGGEKAKADMRGELGGVID